MIAHGENLAKDDVEGPGLGRLLETPLREGALGDIPVWEGKIGRAVSLNDIKISKGRHRAGGSIERVLEGS